MSRHSHDRFERATAIGSQRLLGTARNEDGDESVRDGSIRMPSRAGTGKAPEVEHQRDPAPVPQVGIRPVDSRDCLFTAVISRLICSHLCPLLGSSLGPDQACRQNFVPSYWVQGLEISSEPTTTRLPRCCRDCQRVDSISRSLQAASHSELAPITWTVVPSATCLPPLPSPPASPHRRFSFANAYYVLVEGTDSPR